MNRVGTLVPRRCGMTSRNLEPNCVWDPIRNQIIRFCPTDFRARPRPSDGLDELLYIDIDKMYQWAEDDGDLPLGVGRLDLSEPVSGRRYVMYHGTTSQAARSIMATGFQQSAGGMLGPGVYLSRVLDKASRYPIKHPEHDRVVIKVVVNVGRVIAINYQGHPRQKTGTTTDTARCLTPPGCHPDVEWCQAVWRRIVSGIPIESRSLVPSNHALCSLLLDTVHTATCELYMLLPIHFHCS
uniref:PARP catalytic domain-containing protein n=1 Tax=Labrus bergylta TaxID=56723 RepID=A0A3Q3EPH9_9LABR